MKRSAGAARLAILGTALGTSLIVWTGGARADGTPTSPPPAVAAPPPAVAAPPASVPSWRRGYRAADSDRHYTHENWYGWQTLVVDGIALVGPALLTAGAPEVGGGLLFGGYLFGGPIVHWAHGRVGRGFVDLGMRFGAPLLLGGGGYLAGGSDNDAKLVGIVTGVVFGMLGSIAVDAAVLAREEEDDPDDPEDAAAIRRQRDVARSRPTFTPLIAPHIEPRGDIGGAVVGLSGAF